MYIVRVKLIYYEANNRFATVFSTLLTVLIGIKNWFNKNCNIETHSFVTLGYICSSFVKTSFDLWYNVAKITQSK